MPDKDRMAEADLLNVIALLTEQRDDLRSALFAIDPKHPTLRKWDAKVSEGVGHSQTDRAPSDVPHSGSPVNCLGCRIVHFGLWPESRVT